MGDLGASRIVAPALAIAAPPPSAGIVLAASGTAVSRQSTGATVDLAYPAGITAGDLLVFYLAANGASITLPSGWTSMTGAAGSVASSGGTGSLLLACKVADGSETGNLTVTLASSFCAGRVFRYTGVNATPQDTTAVSDTSATSSLTLTGITTATNGAMEIAVAMSRSSGTTSGPGDYATEDSNPTGNPSTLYLDRIDAVAGATGTVAFTLPGTSTSAAAVHAALRPA